MDEQFSQSNHDIRKLYLPKIQMNQIERNSELINPLYLVSFINKIIIQL